MNLKKFVLIASTVLTAVAGSIAAPILGGSIFV
jgi:hypothetical protein